jgi:hypothetical protein
MNAENEVLNVQEKVKSCRVLDPKELLTLLRMNINMFWSWGARAFTIDNQKNCRMFRMRVSGHHHKGHVYIFVNGSDLFDVYLTTLQGTIKTIGTDLYFDQLAEWIDERVERIPDYVR